MQLAKQPTALGDYLPPRSDSRKGMPLKTLVMTVGHQEKWRVLMETWRVRERGPRFASLVVEYLETHIAAAGCGITRKSIESPAQLHQQRMRFAS